MGTIKLELRKLAEGDASVRMIYQIKGVRGYYSTKQKVYPDNWDSNEQRAKHVKGGGMTAAKVKEVNEALTDLENKVRGIEKKFEALKTLYTPVMVIDELQVDKKQDHSSELYDFIDSYIERNTSARAKGSLSVYKSLKQHLKDFETGTKNRVTFSAIDYNFFEAFRNFLVSKGTINNITIAKQLSTLKTFLNYAKRSGIEVNSKYQSFRITRDTDLEIISFTWPEHDLLLSLDLSKNQAWEQVRDCFIFSCHTGFRYSDLKQLRWNHIGEEFIDLRAVKTSLRTKVPLVPITRAILKKYKDHPKPLPVISNQRMNEHLKKICEWNGINTPVEIVRKYGAKRDVSVFPKHELISMHAGRKSFATLYSERGMPAEMIMKIGGWKDWKSFKRYLNIEDDTMKAAMLTATDNYKSKLKAV